MANALTPSNPEYWSNDMQVQLMKKNFVFKLANTRFEAQLSDGDTINMPYRSFPSINDYTKGTDMTRKDIDTTNEQLTIDVKKYTANYYDDIDKKQNKSSFGGYQGFADDAVKLQNNTLEQAFAGEVTNAASNLYKAGIGESGATTAIELNTSNIGKIFTASGKLLDKKNVERGTDSETGMSFRYALMGPEQMQILKDSIYGREFTSGDKMMANGFVKHMFDFDLYQTNNNYWTATLTTSAAIANAETVTIAGCVFTFKDTITGATGEVYSGGNDADTTAQLVAAVNACTTGTEGTGNTYRLPADASRKLITMAGIVATDASTSMTLVGYGDNAVSTTMAQGANVWSAQKSQLMFAATKAVDFVTQIKPFVEIKRDPYRFGDNFYTLSLSGKKTFLNMKDFIVSAHIDASNYI